MENLYSLLAFIAFGICVLILAWLCWRNGICPNDKQLKKINDLDYEIHVLKDKIDSLSKKIDELCNQLKENRAKRRKHGTSN